MRKGLRCRVRVLVTAPSPVTTHDSAGDQGFVVNQTDGTWGDAIPIPALISLNTGANAQGNSVSCASAGNCAVTGYYTDSAGDDRVLW